MRNKRKSLIFTITLLVLCFGIGYAYLTTTLSINGTTDIDSNNWDIYFDNVQVTDGSVTGDQVTQAPTIDTTTKTTVSFHIRLKEPGEFYEFTVDARNDGTIDAMIELLTKTVNNSTTIPTYLNYSVTYGMGSQIQQKQILRANSQVVYKVRVEYRTDIDPDDLPTSAQTLNLSFGVEYVQADSTGIDNRRAIYTADYNVRIGEMFLAPYEYYEIPPYTYYNTVEEIIDATDYPYYLKVIGENDTVIGGEAVFRYNGNVYSLKGGGATYNSSTGKYNDDSIYYEENVRLVKEVFGEENCEIRTYHESFGVGYIDVFECRSDDTGLRSLIQKNGNVDVGGVLPYGCGVNEDGGMSCGG